MSGNELLVQNAMSSAQAKDMVRFKSKMEALKQNLSGEAGANKDAKLREACKDFEAVFIGKLWQQMRSTVPKEGYLHSKQEDMYISMFDKEFSEKMADSGGIGLADMIYEQLSEKLKATSKDALADKVQIKPLGGTGGIPFDAAKSSVAPLKNEELKSKSLDDWVGSPVSRAVEANPAPVAARAEQARRSEHLSDMEVKARFESLVRRLQNQEAENSAVNAPKVGRNIADIG